MEFALGELNKILLMFGLKRKLPTQFSFEQHQNNMKMNKYMEYQVRRLRLLAKTDPKKFWKIARKLMNGSVAFRVSAINAVYKG